MPRKIPDVMPDADAVSRIDLLWGKVIGKNVRVTGEKDLVIQILDGRQKAPPSTPLPDTPGITLPNVTNVIVPTSLLLAANKTRLDASQQMMDAAVMMCDGYELSSLPAPALSAPALPSIEEQEEQEVSPPPFYTPQFTLCLAKHVNPCHKCRSGGQCKWGP
jgi:hypothetical protein